MTKRENENRAETAAENIPGTIPSRSKRGRKRQAFPPPVTEGQRLLQNICTASNLTYEYIQQRVGAQTPGAVMMWLVGKRRPDDVMRGALLGAFGVPRVSWDQRCSNGNALAPVPPQSASSPPPPAAPPAPARSTTTLEGCLDVLDDIRSARADIVQLLPSERIKLADAETRILALRARLEREAERTEDRIVREHPEWQRLKRAILRALVAHPQAFKDVCEAIGEPAESNGHSG